MEPSCMMVECLPNRRSSRRIGFALLVTALVFACGSTFANAGTLPSWMVIEPGAVAYLNDEGDKFDPPGRRTVCRDLWAYVHRDTTDGKRRCVFRHALGRVRVNRIVAHAASLPGGRYPLVAITSPSGGWSGVVIGLALLPIVPKGTRLQLRRGADCSRSSEITFVNRERPMGSFQITENTPVEVLREPLPDGAHYPIYVRILSGKHRNERVWTLLFTVPYPAFWMQDPANIVP